jgi:hypothetical protein
MPDGRPWKSRRYQREDDHEGRQSAANTQLTGLPKPSIDVRFGGNEPSPCYCRDHRLPAGVWNASSEMKTMQERGNWRQIEFKPSPVIGSRCPRLRKGMPRYFSEVLIELNVVFRVEPRPLTAAMIASAIPAAISPYSIAVAPHSSFQNFKT